MATNQNRKERDKQKEASFSHLAAPDTDWRGIDGLKGIVGYTGHEFARNVYAMIPLSNFGEDLDLNITHRLQHEYSNDFTLSEYVAMWLCACSCLYAVIGDW